MVYLAKVFAVEIKQPDINQRGLESDGRNEL